jgi:hypothetical protein
MPALPPLPHLPGIETDIYELFRRTWQRANDAAKVIEELDKLQPHAPVQLDLQKTDPDFRHQDKRLIPLNVAIMEIHLVCAHFAFNRLPGLWRAELQEVIDSGSRTIAGMSWFLLRGIAKVIAKYLSWLLFAVHAVRETYKETEFIKEIEESGQQLRAELLELFLTGKNRRITRKVENRGQPGTRHRKGGPGGRPPGSGHHGYHRGPPPGGV